MFEKFTNFWNFFPCEVIFCNASWNLKIIIWSNWIRKKSWQTFGNNTEVYEKSVPRTKKSLTVHLNSTPVTQNRIISESLDFSVAPSLTNTLNFLANFGCVRNDWYKRKKEIVSIITSSNFRSLSEAEFFFWFFLTFLEVLIYVLFLTEKSNDLDVVIIVVPCYCLLLCSIVLLCTIYNY